MSLIASKKKNAVFLSMLVLGAVMVALGLYPFPHVALPPIFTGVGFLVLAWGMK